MNAENLIIAHFDRALSPEQEVELQQLLASSPEARALYERHEAMEGLMQKDSASLAPSQHLDEMVIASALGVLTEITGGAGLWFSGKIAAAISAVAIGGFAIAVVATSGPDTPSEHAQRAISPTVLQLPTLPAPAEAPVVQQDLPSAPVAEAPVEEQTRMAQHTAPHSAAGTSATRNEIKRGTPQLIIDTAEQTDIPGTVKVQPK